MMASSVKESKLSLNESATNVGATPTTLGGIKFSQPTLDDPGVRIAVPDQSVSLGFVSVTFLASSFQLTVV